MDTDSLSKSATSTSPDHQMLLNLSTGAGSLCQFGLLDQSEYSLTQSIIAFGENACALSQLLVVSAVKMSGLSDASSGCELIFVFFLSSSMIQ